MTTEAKREETAGKRSKFFALATARRKRRENDGRRYKEVAPGIWISTY